MSSGANEATRQADAQDATQDEATPFRSAEDWLAERGVARQPIRVDTSTLPPAPPPAPTPTAGDATTGATGDGPADVAGPEDNPETTPDEAEFEPLEDAVARAVNFIRRSTTAQPASEGRLREKLRQRDTRSRVIDLALEQARRERLVDDVALVHALAEERRARGHAASRIRMDLRRRGLPDELIDQALAATDREDPEAVAFGVGRGKAPSYAHLEPEAAFRRLVGYLARRGHAEGLARKVAREIIYVEREAERTAGH